MENGWSQFPRAGHPGAGVSPTNRKTRDARDTRDTARRFCEVSGEVEEVALLSLKRQKINSQRGLIGWGEGGRWYNLKVWVQMNEGWYAFCFFFKFCT